MDYFSILNFHKEPFSNSPDPEFFYHSRQHLECLQKLELSLLLRRGLNVIIGDVGTGKTTLCRQLIRRFAPKEEMETYLILDPLFLYPSEFLFTVVKLLTGKKPPAGSPDWQIKEYIKQHLFRKGVDQGKTIVLMIDEGQKIPAFCLEILREFLNYETNEYKLLQIVIFAQSEFEKTVRKYPNFGDRISLYHLLKPLSLPDTRRMIKFRLAKSSKSEQQSNLFTSPAIWAIFRFTGGYPRKIINLCHHSILAMIIQNRSKSNYFLVRKCARRMFRGRSGRRRMLTAAAVMGVAAAIMSFVLMPLDRFKPGASSELQETKTEYFLSPDLETEDRIPKAEILSFADRQVPDMDDIPNRMQPNDSPKTSEQPSGLPAIEIIEAEKIEPQKIEIEETQTGDIEADDSIVATVATPVEEPPDKPFVQPTYPATLGRITLKRNETLSRIIRKVYGGFNTTYLKSFISANPDIDNPDRVAVGQLISLPAIPVSLRPERTSAWWVKVDETATLDAAFGILRNQPDGFPPVKLVPYWTPAEGSKFAIVLDKIFKDEASARAGRENLPAAISSEAAIVSRWEKKTIFFANPYAVSEP
jgi:general secretion pathway protein A